MAWELPQQDPEKNSFKQVKTTVLNANHRNTSIIIKGIQVISHRLVSKWTIMSFYSKL